MEKQHKASSVQREVLRSGRGVVNLTAATLTAPFTQEGHRHHTIALVDDFTQGYGIFTENMLNAAV